MGNVKRVVRYYYNFENERLVCFFAGVSKSDDWPESLRSLVQASSTPPPASGSTFTPAKGKLSIN